MRSKGFFYNLAGFVFEYFCDSLRILATFAKFCLNSLFATWSYRFTCHPAARAQAPLHLPHKFFCRKKLSQMLPLLPIVIAISRLNTSGISSQQAVLLRRLGDLVSAKKKLRTGGGVCKVLLCQKSMCGRWRGAWARAGWRVWDLGNGTIMLQKLFIPNGKLLPNLSSPRLFLSAFLFH